MLKTIPHRSAGQGELYGVHERLPGGGGGADAALPRGDLRSGLARSLLRQVRRLHRRLQESQHPLHAPLRESHQGGFSFSFFFLGGVFIFA